MTAETVHEILKTGRGADIAIIAPDREPLTYDGLRALAGEVQASLRRAGVGRGGRVAIVLPNGPEMAAAFLTIAASATTAPLNPGYRTDEFRFYLEDLHADALLVEAGSELPAIAVAEDLGIAVHRLHVPPEAPAGAFRIEAGDGQAASGGWAEAGDTALVLHTSGTTSRPKIVPLSQANIAASARHIRTTLALTPADRCLNIMPLFHIHGLMAAVLSSVAAGASIFATPGFNALKFGAWLNEAQPTWYTAVPTMHQAILARLGRDAGGGQGGGPALHPLVLVLPRAADSGRARSPVRLPGHRILRHDRGRPSDGVQSPAAGAAQAGKRRAGRRSRGGGDGRRREASWSRKRSARSSSGAPTS